MNIWLRGHRSEGADADPDAGSAGWLAQLLNPSGTVGPKPHEQYALLPNARDVRVIVPLTSRRAGERVLRQTAHSRGLARSVLGWAVGLGLTPLVGGRLTVPARDEDGNPSLATWLGELLGIADISIGITLGAPRPNRKPVISMVTPDGTVHAYAKLAWSPLTNDLVRNEATWLDWVQRRRPEGIVAPELITIDTWRDHNVLLTRPLADLPTVPGGIAEADTVGAIAGLVTPTAGPVVGSPWWQGLEQRAADRASAGHTESRAVLDGLAHRLDGTSWRFGAWHGDYTPWNARLTKVGVQVWDWERASFPVPVGFDAAHASFQIAHIGSRRDVHSSADAATDHVATVLDGLDLDRSAATDLVSCYLLERWLRWDEARGDGQSALENRHAAILQALEQRALTTKP
jgi:hypothetical protein